MKESNALRVEPARLWGGSGEALFNVLPQTILANFYSPRSENALLWNLIYPRAQPSLSLNALLELHALWGTPSLVPAGDDQLIPYYWGYRLDGSSLEKLEDVLMAIDGPGPKTEIDLILLGDHYLFAVEGKHTSGFGRCARYQSHRCPEVHGAESDEMVCRYWEPGVTRFSDVLELGDRPTPESDKVPCNIHYQLARTYLIGRVLAEQLDRDFALWVFLPKIRWRALEPGWLDFIERVRDDHAWSWMRVLAWEQIQSLPTR
jgi:hypothetical protein